MSQSKLFWALPVQKTLLTLGKKQFENPIKPSHWSGRTTTASKATHH